jgi:hypothetical protein
LIEPWKFYPAHNFPNLADYTKRRALVASISHSVINVFTKRAKEEWNRLTFLRA